MVDMSRFGYKNVTSLRRAINVPRETWNKMLLEKSWYLQKIILLHPECPQDVRLKFAQDKLWYKRLTAIFAKRSNLKHLATIDPDPRIRRIVYRDFYHLVCPLLENLQIIKGGF